jgi:hypothetical protein
MSFIIGKLKAKQACFGFGNLILRFQDTRVVNPTILDFIPENVAKLSMKMVVSKEKDKIGSLFNLICSLKSQSAIVFLQPS